MCTFFTQSMGIEQFGHLFLLGSKNLDLNVLELQFVMLANHDQNV